MQVYCLLQLSLVTLPGIMQGSCAGSCRFDEKALLCRLHADLGSWRLDGGCGMSAAFPVPNAESLCCPSGSKPGCCAAPACTEALPPATDAAGRDKPTEAAPAQASAHSEAVPHASDAVAEDRETSVGTTSAPHAAAGEAANAARIHSLPPRLSLPAFTAPLSPATLRQHPGCADAAAEAPAAAGDSINKQILAGLPKLHASTLEVLCVSGLLAAAQTDEDWASVDLHVFQHSTLWLTDFVQVWLVESSSQPQPTVLPALESHIQLLCESPRLT